MSAEHTRARRSAGRRRARAGRRSPVAATIDPAWLGGTRGPALQALIRESRILLNHPFEDLWWTRFVTAYIRRNPAQTTADIEARNAGYATFRGPAKRVPTATD